MTTTFQRAPVTDFLLNYLNTVDLNGSTYLCGDGVIPVGSGWNTKQPAKPGSTFKPYMVLTTMTAIPAPATGSPPSPQEDWHVPYLLQVFGIARKQSESLMDWVRVALGQLTHVAIDCSSKVVPAPNNFRVASVWSQSIGGINVTPGTDPLFYGQQDQFTLWLMKARS